MFRPLLSVQNLELVTSIPDPYILTPNGTLRLRVNEVSAYGRLIRRMLTLGHRLSLGLLARVVQPRVPRNEICL